ncbi:MAG: hypothetical protein R2771_14640 [Saprospiraceae bacterium]
MISTYNNMPDSYWRENQIKTLINKFSEGQVVIKVNGNIAGVALSIIVNSDDFDEKHTYREITADYTFNSL